MSKDLTFLYAQYIKERENMECKYSEYGFVTYQINLEKDYVYICDVYVVPEKRKQHIALGFVKDIIDIALDLKVNNIITSLDQRANNWQYSQQTIIRCGFQFLSQDPKSGVDYYIRSIHGEIT
jgi:hypothetical protein